MVDATTAIAHELELLSPREAPVVGDWDDVMRRTQALPKSLRSAQVGGRLVKRRTLGLATFALGLVAAGVAVAAIALTKTETQEAQGLLEGHSVFAGTRPACSLVADGRFRCVLDQPPTGEGTTIEGSYRGSKFQTVDGDRRVDGGCIGVSDDGRIWDCYLGELAVRHEIVGAELLGQIQPEPGRG